MRLRLRRGRVPPQGCSFITGPTMTPNEPYMRNVAYTHGYYRELSPTMISAALESQGVTPPDLAAPLNYCELGMGFGVSLLVNAACFPHMRFYGNDFNPEHVAYARRWADEAGLANVELFEDGFEELLQRDLPPMDVIVMHGVYTWVSAAQQQVIIDFIDRRLKPGGVVYVSHNTLPACAAQMPLRQLVHRHATRGRLTRPAEQLTDSVAVLREVQALGAHYFEDCPSAAVRLTSWPHPTPITRCTSTATPTGNPCTCMKWRTGWPARAWCAPPRRCWRSTSTPPG
jgi:predicted O-methyltransferase YrrM